MTSCVIGTSCNEGSRTTSPSMESKWLSLSIFNLVQTQTTSTDSLGLLQTGSHSRFLTPKKWVSCLLGWVRVGQAKITMFGSTLTSESPCVFHGWAQWPLSVRAGLRLSQQDYNLFSTSLSIIYKSILEMAW